MAGNINSKTKADPKYYSRIRKWPSLFTISTGSFILDIGCGVGLLGEYLKDRYNAHVTGVDIIEENCEIAGQLLDSVICCDIAIAKITQFKKSYDVVIFSDSLEHMIEPEKVLNFIKPLLSPSGKVLLSIPNVRNFRVTFPLLFKNEWTYQEEGLLDYTHLRFFTGKSISRMLQDCGYAVTRIYLDLPLFSKVGIVNILTFGFFRNHLTSHYFIEACLRK